MRVLPRLSAPVLPEAAAAAETTPPGAWALALAQPAFRWRLLLVAVLLGLLVGMAVPPFYAAIQQRPGAVLADPLLAQLPRHDVAVPIFVAMYGALAAGLAWLLRRPQQLVRGLWAYLLLSGLRMATIWLVPLLPPPGLLPLPDPLTSLAFHGVHSELITHDLFFSGHTATVALLALLVQGRRLRWALGLATVLVGGLVLVQRVHYSYDVLAAPCFAWLACWLAGQLTSAEAAAPAEEA